MAGGALEAFERAVDVAIAQEGPARGDTFRRLRKALGMPAAELAELLAVRAETVSRWETGATPVDRAAWSTLAAMVLEQRDGRSTTIDRLRALHQSPTLAKLALDVEVSDG